MVDMVMVTGDDVRDLRTELELSQSEIADVLGVSKKTVYNWESRGDLGLPERASRRFVTASKRAVLERQWSERLSAGSRRLLGVGATESRPVNRELVELIGHLEGTLDRVKSANRGNEAELADKMARLTELASSALDFAELGAVLGVEPRVIKQLTEGVVTVIIDSGAFSLFSSTDGYRDVPMAILARSGDIYRRARSTTETRPFATFELHEDGDESDAELTGD